MFQVSLIAKFSHHNLQYRHILIFFLPGTILQHCINLTSLDPMAKANLLSWPAPRVRDLPQNLVHTGFTQWRVIEHVSRRSRTAARRRQVSSVLFFSFALSSYTEPSPVSTDNSICCFVLWTHTFLSEIMLWVKEWDNRANTIELASTL